MLTRDFFTVDDPEHTDTHGVRGSGFTNGETRPKEEKRLSRTKW